MIPRALGRCVMAAGVLALGGCGGDPPSVEAREAPYDQDGRLPADVRPRWRPNVLVLCFNRLTHEDVFGDGAGKRSSFGRFAQHATVFDNAAATSGSEGPSFVSLLTGKYARTHGVTIQRGERVNLVPATVTLAEVLRAQGWRTAAFTEGRVFGSGTGTEQGFDDYVEDWYADEPRSVEAWLKRVDPRPFFVVLHVKPGPAVWNPEAFLHRVQTWTKETTPLVTIVTADCGTYPADYPAFGEREATLHDALIHVPLAVSAPGRMPPRHVAGSCSIVDVVPTILELVGLPNPADTDGRSLVALADDPAAEGRPVRAYQAPAKHDLFTIRASGVKFVANRDIAASRWTETFFDLTKDPAEAVPLPGDRAGGGATAFDAAVRSLRDALRGKGRSAEEILRMGYGTIRGY